MELSLIMASGGYRIGKIMVFPERFLWWISNSGFQFEMGGSASENIDRNMDWYVENEAAEKQEERRSIQEGNKRQRREGKLALNGV